MRFHFLISQTFKKSFEMIEKNDICPIMHII